MNFPIEIKELESELPHRPPMVWVDRVLWIDATKGECEVQIDPQALYCENGKVRQVAPIEWIAQTVGFCRAARDKSNPERKIHEAFLVGIKNTKIEGLEILKPGDTVRITAEIVRELAPLTLVKGTVTYQDKCLAVSTLKLFSI